MRCSFLFILLNMTSMSTVTCFKPNVFWNRAKTMTKFISGEVYRRTKTAIAPIVARTKPNTNGGFYEGIRKPLLPPTFNDNKFIGNHMYQGHVASGYMPQPAPVVEDPHSTNGLYEEYRRSMGSHPPAPEPAQVPPPPHGLYENYRSSMSVMPAPVPAPAPVPMPYTQGLAMPSYAPTPVPAPAPIPASMPYTHGLAMPSYEPTPVPAPAPVPASMPYTHGHAMPSYAPTPVPALAPVVASVPVSYTNGLAAPVSVTAPVPLPVPVPAPVTENKQYSTDGLYEEYRRSLQNSNPVSETPTSHTSTGFYVGQKASKKDETPVTKPVSQYERKYSGGGFYQGQ